MPLLELNNYQSVCYRWENSLKSINKKLGDYQAIVMSIGVEEVRAQQGQQREVENGKMITLNKIKENIEDIRAKMQDNSITSSPALSQFNPQSRLIQSLYQPLNNQQSQSFNSINPNPLTQFQQQSSQALQQLKKHINMSLAIFKNQLLLSQFSQPNQPHQFSPNSQPQKPSTQYQQQSISKYTQNIFSELKKQIQYLRSNLDVQDIRDFHQKTMDRLSCDIAQLEDMFEIFFDQDEAGWEREAWVRELGVIEEKVMVIGWQIKGMRKKYFYEINRMYCVEKDGFQANVFEKIVEKDLQLLEKAFKQLKAKFLSIKSSTNQTTDNFGFNKSKLH